MAQEELYSSATLRVFAVVAPTSNRDRIVASFANWLGAPSLTAPGAAERLLTPHGIDAVHFNCAGNHWWQYEDLPQALEAARQFMASWRQIVTYGSSMGGYAAFHYAAALGATCAVAACPQFSIQRSVMPKETRWADDLVHITFRHESDFKAAPGCHYLAVYDPLLRVDAMHVQEYKRHVSVTDVLLPCSGHPPLELLLAYGNLSRVTLELLRGTYRPSVVRAEHRAKRRTVAHYWYELAGRLRERKHYRAMIYACERAIELAPTQRTLRRVVNLCSAAGLRDQVAKYQQRLADAAA